jgi:hypothetical protein
MVLAGGNGQKGSLKPYFKDRVRIPKLRALKHPKVDLFQV